MKSYISVEGRCRTELVVNKSRFIATAIHVESADEAQQCIAAIKKEFSDATHNCYAYVLGSGGIEQRMSDDGEPQGTAGMPMLEVLKRQGLTDTLAVVTRYFGGIKLGAAGLVGAYTEAVAGALESATRTEYIYSRRMSVVIDYTSLARVQKLLQQENCSIISQEFDAAIRIDLAVPDEDAERIAEALSEQTAGKARIEYGNKEYYSYKR